MYYPINTEIETDTRGKFAPFEDVNKMVSQDIEDLKNGMLSVTELSEKYGIPIANEIVRLIKKFGSNIIPITALAGIIATVRAVHIRDRANRRR
jgi:hypothetical protein